MGSRIQIDADRLVIYEGVLTSSRELNPIFPISSEAVVSRESMAIFTLKTAVTRCMMAMNLAGIFDRLELEFYLYIVFMYDPIYSASENAVLTILFLCLR